MRAVKEPPYLTGTGDEVGIGEDALFHGDHFQRHQLRLLVVHADHVVELPRCRVQRDSHGDDHRAVVAHVGELLQRDTPQLVPGEFNFVGRIRVSGAVARSDKMRHVLVHVLQQEDARIVRHIPAPHQGSDLVAVPLGTQPARAPAVREDHIVRGQATGDDVSRRVRLQRVTHMPRRLMLLRVPADDYRGHAVGDEVPAPLLHLHRQPVLLPPARHDTASGLSHPVVLAYTGTAGGEVHGRDDGSDAASHLIDARSEQVRSGRHLILLHVRERNLHRPVVDRLDQLHLRVKRAIVVEPLPVQGENLIDSHAIPLRA